ncbi:hypothetical protein PYCCODRAFT_1301709 [Trametes coccinea BRFM310]|uniref:Uncharacterized protein n=1 Tax=Trametes coccinea (strain BRFM310) TaxID=1353009 RepID=A0A1Y2IX46_TRAC3|nr:hypothetical protein PYCCODRAFT_1301709 [Trametes coccinea BRFM310]
MSAAGAWCTIGWAMHAAMAGSWLILHNRFAIVPIFAHHVSARYIRDCMQESDSPSPSLASPLLQVATWIGNGDSLSRPLIPITLFRPLLVQHSCLPLLPGVHLKRPSRTCRAGHIVPFPGAASQDSRWLSHCPWQSYLDGE